MKKLISSILLIASSVVMAKGVIVDSTLPITDLSIETNRKANIVKNDDKRFHAMTTIDVAGADCNETAMVTHLGHKIRRSYTKFVLENIVNQEHKTSHENLITFYVKNSNDPSRTVDKTKDMYKIVLFNVRGYRPLSKEDIAAFKLFQPIVSVVSTTSPLTMICQGIFVTSKGDKMTVRFDITRDLETNKKSYYGTDEVTTDDVLSMNTLLKTPNQREAGFLKMYENLSNYAKSKCTKDCFTKEQHGYAVDFLIGDIRVEQAFKLGLRF